MIVHRQNMKLRDSLMWNQPIAMTFESAVHITMASTLYFMKPTLKDNDDFKIGKATNVFTVVFLVICMFSQIAVFLLLFRMIKKKPSRFKFDRFKGFRYLFKDLNLRNRWSFMSPLLDFSRRSLMCYCYIFFSDLSGQQI